MPNKKVTFNPGINRRRFMQAGGSAIAICTSTSRGMAENPTKKANPWDPPTLHVYDDYGWLRGFNCVPSWGARIEDAWWFYDSDRFREEMALARSLHSNCIRLWIEFAPWMARPDEVTAHFFDAVKAIDEAGMKTMPCLFNRWHSRNGWDYGGTYLDDMRHGGNWRPRVDYLKALVQPLAKDPRILIWDLCNEPQSGLGRLSAEDDKREIAWLTKAAAELRQMGVQQPITIGTMKEGNIVAFEHLVDVLCGHPYALTAKELASAIASLQVLRKRFSKPLLVNECMPGCLDDMKRAKVARFTSEQLSAAGFGWMSWGFMEGKAVATRRDRMTGPGIDGQGFHPWFTKEGVLRGGLQFLKETPDLQPPWEK